MYQTFDCFVDMCKMSQVFERPLVTNMDLRFLRAKKYECLKQRSCICFSTQQMYKYLRQKRDFLFLNSTKIYECLKQRNCIYFFHKKIILEVDLFFHKKMCEYLI